MRRVFFLNSWPKFHQMSAEHAHSRSRISVRPGFGLRPGCPILFPVRVWRGGDGREASGAVEDLGTGVGAAVAWRVLAVEAAQEGAERRRKYTPPLVLRGGGGV